MLRCGRVGSLPAGLALRPGGRAYRRWRAPTSGWGPPKTLLPEPELGYPPEYLGLTVAEVVTKKGAVPPYLVPAALKNHRFEEVMAMALRLNERRAQDLYSVLIDKR